MNYNELLGMNPKNGTPVKFKIPKIKLPNITVPEVKLPDLAAILNDAIKEGFNNIKVEVPTITVPPVIVPPFPDFPTIPTPTVNVAAPIVNVQERPIEEVTVKGFDTLTSLIEKQKLDFSSITAQSPIHVILTTPNGKEYIAMGGQGGGTTVGTTISRKPGSGQKNVTTAGTAVKLSATTIPCRSVTIKAKIGNTGSIYVGDSSVSSSNGFILAAGETLSMDISDVSYIYIDSSVNSEGVSFFYVV